jgi:hypothetical protein
VPLSDAFVLEFKSALFLVTGPSGSIGFLVTILMGTFGLDN